MDPKFVKLEDAAAQLKITPDHLNALREEGKLRAYRDGASWKFRTEEVEKMASDGVPPIDSEESGINLDLDDLSLGGDRSFDDEPEVDAASETNASDPALHDNADEPLELELPPEDTEQSDLQLADDDGELELATGSSADLSIDLDDEQPTATSQPEQPAAEASGLDLDLADDSNSDDPESILLSEAELGDSSDRPPSTIIGKSELDDDLDLELASPDSSSKSDAAMSDVQLADLEDLDSGSAATGELPAGEQESADFDDVEELGIDLEAESSRILSPEDVAAAQAAAGSQAQQKSPETSDLELDLDDDYDLAPTSDAGIGGSAKGQADDDDDDLVSGSEINLDDASGKGSEAGLTGLSALELDDDDDDDDDFVLGDGSDLTLSSADSGINLTPADSGLSLDDAAVDLTGSAIGSGIDFGEASSLVSDEPAADFELTPMVEEASDEDDDDSSQVIALDEFEEQPEADGLLGAEAGGGAAAMPAAASFSQGAVTPRAEAQFSGWNVFFLSLCLVLLSLCGMMALDVVRSMWSWNEPYQVNSSLIDSLSGFLFP